MPQTSFPDDKIYHALLELAATKRVFTLQQVAQKVKIPFPQFKKRFSSLADFIPLLMEGVDRYAFARRKFSGTPHDILFDAVMARFDVLQKRRKAVLHLISKLKPDSRSPRLFLQASVDGAYRLIDVVKVRKPKRLFLMMGLALIHGWIFKIWCEDESPDMAATMAALDRLLRFSGQALKLFKNRD